MKNLVRFAVAGALMAGYATAQAQVNLPSTDNSDLWLFVSDTAASTTFAVDTGITINSLLPSGSLAATSTTGSNAILSNSIADSVSFTSSAVASYISTAVTAGHSSSLEWGVEAIQYTPNASTGAPAKAAQPGSIKGVMDNVASQESNTSNMVLTNLTSWVNGFEGDTTYLAPTYTAGGKVYAWSAGSTAGNVWGSSGGSLAGSTSLYGQGPDQAGVNIGGSTVLYGLTGAGNSGQVQSYVLTSDLTLNSAGTLSSPVPLPAAVWLFGSGLLGLVGVGRRRAAAV